MNLTKDWKQLEIRSFAGEEWRRDIKTSAQKEKLIEDNIEPNGI